MALFEPHRPRPSSSRTPQAKHVFEQWKQEGNRDSRSPVKLAKNQELKDVVLSETPWVADADREEEQKQRLGDFFDENLMNSRITETAKKLKDLQNGDGSWSWWPGMSGSFYMTVSISEMLARLNVMAGKQQETAQMLDKAFSFMGNEMVERGPGDEADGEEGQRLRFPSFNALQWLYICALDGRELPQGGEGGQRLPHQQAEEGHQEPDHLREGPLGHHWPSRGDTAKPSEYAQSLKEYTVFTEEKGRYYDTPRAGYSWYDYKIPTEVMAIEALKMITPQDEQTIEEMQRWLLQEKRTQAWDTPINSVNAVYAFLFDNTKLLDAQEAPNRAAIDGKQLELPRRPRQASAT